MTAREPGPATRPPRFAAALIRRLYESGQGDDIAADLVAEHRARRSREGRLRAFLWTWKQVAWALAPALRVRSRRRGPANPAGGVPWPGAPAFRGTLRRIVNHPGMSLGVVTVLGLGIAAGTAASSVLSGVLLDPLPYDRPERIGLLRVDRPGAPDHPLVTGREYAAVEDASSVAEAAVVVAGLNLALETPEGSRPVVAGGVGPDLFRVLGVSPALGRAFRASDLDDGGGVTLLTWRLWQRELGGDPDVLGRSVTLGGRPYTVVGVLPRDFRLFVGRDARGAEDAALFFPVPVGREDARFAAFRTLVRLADGVGWEAAQDELGGIAGRVAEMDPENLGGPRDYRLVPLGDDVVAEVRPAVLGLLVAVGLVVLIASLNAAGLLAARGSARAREYAVRAALGANRGQLVAHSLLESAVLALAATALGIAVGTLFLEVILARVPLDVPRVDSVGLDARALVLSTVLAGTVTVAFGLLPSLQAGHASPLEALREGGARVVGPGRVRYGLVVAQIAVTLVLLLGTGLMIRTLRNLRSVPLGFGAEELHTAKLVAPPPPEGVPWWRFFRDVVDGVEAHPAVEGAAAISRTPLVERSDVDLVRYGASADGAAGEARADLRWVLPEAFDVLGVPFLEGRTFTEEELSGERPVVVLDRRMAERLFPGTSAVGREVYLPRRFGGDPEAARVVGVVEHQRIAGLREEGPPQAFRPASHMPWGVMTLVVRSSLPPTELRRHVRTVADAHGARNLFAEASMEDIVAGLTAGTTLATVTVGGLGLIGAVASAVGLYGLLAFVVARSRRDIGLRIALGAHPRAVTLRYLGAGARLGLLGSALGAGMAFLLGGIVEASLFGVSPRDPTTWVAVSVCFLGVAVAAAWGPARRAASVDPAETLRAD